MQIKKLGIELRKIGDTKTFYDEVDIVLSKYNIPTGSISIDVQVQAVAHSLQRMLNIENYLSVCTIEKCAKLCQINIPKERMRVYSTVHCVNWNEMLADFRQMIIAMVLDDFRSVLNLDN